MSILKFQELIKRHRKIELDEFIVDQFFGAAGEYPGASKTYSILSTVWKSVLLEQFPTNIFSVLENRNKEEIKEAYENYYVYGISDGACGGKGLEKFLRRWEITKRNINRAKILQEHLGMVYKGNNNYLLPSKFYPIIKTQFKIPEIINVGQPWGWRYEDSFYHYELTDHLYFADIIIKILKLLNLNKVCFLGDGSGLTGCLVNNNYKIELSNFVDLAHFLFQQFILNQDQNSNFFYAETFKHDSIIDSQILINQDSFPEIRSDCLEKYINCLGKDKIKYVLSYNIEKYNERHVDFRSMLIESGMNSLIRFESALRKDYIIELFRYN
tara:strand:+ start:254 stop:1234 length:981 start_codon:yes stop_codon:yes gene_type:complete